MIDIAKIVSSAFTIASKTFGIVKSSTYTQIGNSGYDPSTGSVSTTSATATVNAIFGNFEEKNPPLGYREGDKRIILQASELASLASVSMDDKITDGQGKDWIFISIERDATNSVYIIHGRTNAQ